uniref:DacS6 n=1 Tax=Dactylosporangium sp. SC14051 TaxID=1239282 RepID=K4I7X6_9ACTN|nr:DacS6 [Dactylosporangium sp. SC14051]
MTTKDATAVDVADAADGALRRPVTAEGRRLLDALGGCLAEVRAGAQVNHRDRRFPTGVFDRFRDHGVLGGTVPAELGGFGVGRLHDTAVALAALGEADPSTALALHVQFSRGLTLTYEWRHGRPAVRPLAERLLRAMARGDALICGAVKDHRDAVTELTPDGEGGYLLSGRKTMVSMGPVATHFVVSAQLPAAGAPPDLVAPVVRRDTAGLTVLDGWDPLGMRASGTVDVVFDRCPVPAGDVFARGRVGARDDAVLAGQTVSSCSMLGIYVGAAQAARDAAVGHVRDRGGEPPAAVCTLVADIDARLFAVRATVAAALTEVDRVSADTTLDPGERGRRMMTAFQCAKMTVNSLAPALVDDCLTVVGGAAYTAGHPLARLARDVRASWFMQPYTYPDGVGYLSGQALRLDRDNNYVSTRAGGHRS